MSPRSSDDLTASPRDSHVEVQQDTPSLDNVPLELAEEDLAGVAGGGRKIGGVMWGGSWRRRALERRRLERLKAIKLNVKPILVR